MTHEFPATPADAGVLEGFRQDIPLDARVSQVLIREIIAGHHPPGIWLREQEVAGRLGVSRPTVREAFRQVFRAGFVDLQPWRGAQVIELTARDTEGLLILLEAHFGAVAEIAARAPTDAPYMTRVDALLPKLKTAAASGALTERVNLSFEIARLLAKAGGNATAHDALTRIGSLVLWQHRFLEAADRPVAIRSYKMLAAVVAAVKASDAETAAAAARAVVRITRHALIPRLPHP